MTIIRSLSKYQLYQVAIALSDTQQIERSAQSKVAGCEHCYTAPRNEACNWADILRPQGLEPLNTTPPHSPSGQKHRDTGCLNHC